MAIDTPSAAAIVTEALRAESESPDRVALFVTMAVARLETGYGAGWHSPPHGPEAPGSNNWGAIQAVNGGQVRWLGKQRPSGAAPRSPEPGRYFLALDYSPTRTNPDGSVGSWFWYGYAVYPSALDGARAVVRQIRKRNVYTRARQTPTELEVSTALYGYYQGMTVDRRQAIESHARRLGVQLREIEERLGMPSPLEPFEPRPTQVEPAGDAGALMGLGIGLLWLLR